MKETLSATMDGESAEEDLAAVFARVKDDAELRRAWDAWHLIGDALRGHGGIDLAARVGRRLAEEPTALAPRTPRPAPARVAWYAMSAAASVAAVALVAWTALAPMQPRERLTGDATTGAPFVPVAASAPAPVVDGDARADVEDYLLAHQPYSHAGAAAAPADLSGAGWVVRAAPAGFRIVSEMTRTLGGTTGVGHIVLSDGLAAISVFIEPLKPSAPPPGLVRRGATNVYMRQLGNHWITVVGEAPAEGVKYVADAVEFRK